MAKRNVHVVRRDDGWAVLREGAQRDSSHHDTQGQAIRAGERSARADQVELFIHGRDGKIRDRDSYGPDPCPPKDTKH
jgi:hypothetical protein